MATAYPSTLYASVFCALMGAFSFGYHLGVLNTCTKILADEMQTFESLLAPLATCSLLFGAAIGSVFAGQIADKFGPKRAALLNNFPLALGTVACGVSNSVVSLCIGRLVAGFGSGAASLFVPRYIAEVSPPQVRGALGTLTQVFINIGILASYLAGLPYEFGDSASVELLRVSISWWRCMFFLALLPSMVQCIMSSTVPESPVWLQWMGEVDLAQSSTAQLVGGHGDGWEGSEDDTRRSLLADEETASPAPQVRGEVVEGWQGLFKRRYRWIMAITTALPILQQLSGVNTVILYSSEVFRKASLNSPIVATLLVGVVNLGFTFVSSALMDKAGRKTLLLTSHFGMGSCLVAMSVAMSVAGDSSVSGVVTFVAILSYIAFFALGVGPIPWLYIGEVMPNEIKGKAGAFCTSLNWVTTLLVGLTFPSMLAWLDIMGSYVVYAVFNFGAFAFFVVWMVETRQQSLPQIRNKLLLKDKAEA